jgi:iron complex outermembrane receptor protein
MPIFTPECCARSATLPSSARHAVFTAALAVLLALPLSTAAQPAGDAAPKPPPESAPATPDMPAPATAMSRVVVTATRTERLQLDVPASVDLIEAEAIRDAQLRVNLSESLVRVPGIVVLNRQNYAQDLQISMRGFGSRASFGVRGVRLYVDGVPATAPDGQGQVSHFPLNLAERIEVLRGPFSALYGNSSGGVIALTTTLAPHEPRFELSAAAGSDATWRAGLSATGGIDPYAFALDAGRFETDGARDHSAAQRDTLNLRVAFLDSPLGRVRLSLNSLAMPDSQDPLGLTRAQWQADPEQAAPVALQFNTRKTSRQSTLGAEIQSALATATTLTTALWVGTRSVIQFQAIPVAAQTAPTSPGGVIDFDRGFGGADLRVAHETGGLTATLGLTAERLDEDRRGYNNFVGTTPALTLGVQGALRRDETNRIDSLAPYLQVEYALGSAWRLHAGVRSTEVDFRSSDNYVVGANGDDSGRLSFSGVTPTAGVVYRPSPTTSVYASYGRGFETPTLNELAYRPDGSAGFNPDLRPARSDNAEIGAKLAGPTLRASVAAFAVRTTDDIVVRTNVGGRSSFANAARTRREGVEASTEWTPRPDLSLLVAAALLRARFDSAFLTCGPAPCTTPTLPVAAGNRLPGVPEQTLFTQLKYRLAGTDLTADWRLQSALYVDDRNTDRAPGYGVVSLAAARTFAWGGHAPRLFVRVDNLFDKGYAGSVIVNEGNSRFFEPAPGRTFLAGVDWPL